ncbi:hypothetical protein EDB83DRAFT_2516495 [Lactarius deliciosus]|nr:hypothetical protein EDB83DRAFT_2516495 [Lactarius deliciosus]
MSPPPPGVQDMPQTLPQPPHLPPPVAGLPIPNDGQHAWAGLPMNAPTYPHPYGMTFYPPVYPPVLHHHPHGASMGAAPGQPWGYPQYPVAPPSTPFLAHPSATQNVTTGEDLPAQEACGRVADGSVVQNTPGCEDMARTGGRRMGVNAAPSSAVDARPRRSCPNKEVSKGVDGKIKHTFHAQTDMKWRDFLDEVRHHFDYPHREVQVGYRISGEAGAMSYLASENDWDNAIVQLLGKVRSARTRAVSMEIKNMHESARARGSKAYGPKKGKEKRRREDDVPPELTQDMLDHLLELQQHLLPLITQISEKLSECRLADALWAKHMSLGKATKYTRPNVKKFDYPPTKKPRTAHTTPEVHVSVNITPTPGAGSSAVQATYTTSSSSPPTPRPSGPEVTPKPGSCAMEAIYVPSRPSSPVPSPLGPAQTSDNPPPTTPPNKSSIPGPKVPLPLQALHLSVLLVLLNCVGNWTVLLLRDVLRLMDAHRPVIVRSYVDLHEELVDLGIGDAVDLYSLPIELLATFGWLRQDSARHLLEFCRGRFLFPLGLLEEGSVVSASNSPLTDIGVSDDEGQSMKEEDVDEMVLEWLDGVDAHKEIEGDEDEADGGEEHGDMAMSL